jgi:hypothetical protein
MDAAGSRIRLPSLRSTLVLDAAFEYAAGAALIVFAARFGGWLGIHPSICIAVGAVFMAAGVAISFLAAAREIDRPLARALAFANVAGGAAGWIAFVAAWPWLDPEGRWLLGMASDAFIVVGLLELRALRADPTDDVPFADASSA